MTSPGTSSVPRVTSDRRQRLQQAEINCVKNGIKIGLCRDKFLC